MAAVVLPIAVGPTIARTGLGLDRLKSIIKSMSSYVQNADQVLPAIIEQ